MNIKSKKTNSRKQWVLLLVLAVCFCFAAQSVEAKSKVERDKFSITVYNQENETLPDCLVEIETTIKVYREYTNGNGGAKFKVKKEEGEAPKYKVSKDGYKTSVGILLQEVRNAAGDLIVKLERV